VGISFLIEDVLHLNIAKKGTFFIQKGLEQGIMKLSGAVITFNEASNIGDCIDSLNEVCDEVVVLDSGSTDSTLDIARSKGARIFSEEWNGFENAKNRLNELSEGAYVLNLDADERLSDELVSSIKAVKGKLSGSYEMNRLNNYCGSWIKHCGWYPDRKVRLFPKSTMWRGGQIHEFPDIDPSQISHLGGDILHFTYPQIEDHLTKLDKYASLSAEKLSSKGKFSLFLKLMFSPMARFVKMYILQLGFMDGKAGWNLCRITARGQRMKYSLALKMKK
jgi:glycosyltransferase involved in cell wall biosynthesis